MQRTPLGRLPSAVRRNDNELALPAAVGACLSVLEGRVDTCRQDGKADRKAREHAPSRARPTVPGGARTFAMWTVTHRRNLSCLLSWAAEAGAASVRALRDWPGDALTFLSEAGRRAGFQGRSHLWSPQLYSASVCQAAASTLRSTGQSRRPDRTRQDLRPSRPARG